MLSFLRDSSFLRKFSFAFSVNSVVNSLYSPPFTPLANWRYPTTPEALRLSEMYCLIPSNSLKTPSIAKMDGALVVAKSAQQASLVHN